MLILICTFGLTACNRNETAEKKPAQAAVSALSKKPAAVPVRTDKPSVMTIEEKVVVSGTFYSQKEVNLSPKVGGKLDYIGYEAGDRVKEGTVLFRIDAFQYRLNLERAVATLEEVKSREVQARAALKQARLDLAYKKLDLKRHRNLLKTETIAQYIFDRVKNAYDIAAASVDSARAQINVIRATFKRTQKEVAIARQNFKDTVVKAPFSGVVTQRKSNVGEMCQPGSVVLSMEKTDTMELWVEISSSYLARIHIGTPLYFLPDGWKKWQRGTVARIEPKVDETTRKIRIAAFIQNPKRDLVPGLFAKTEIVVAVYPAALVIPSVAVVQLSNKKTVFVAENQHAVPRPVTTGYEANNRIVVKNGLKSGETVIISGHTNLKGGEPITVVGGE